MVTEIKSAETRNKEILDKIEQCDRILVGLGEEFDDTRRLRQRPEYMNGCEKLKDIGYEWLLPAWDAYWHERQGCGDMVSALEKLAVLLKGKNAFLVSTSVNGRIAQSGIRTVMPCGSGQKKQCAKGCKGVIEDITAGERKRLWQGFELLASEKAACEMSIEDKACQGKLQEIFCLGTCPECGEPLVLNTIYTENYNENGYLEQWNQYTKWLQGTLNRQLLVLELGVGMQFPTVIRWPFEKVAFFNQKAFFCRVNEKLYQLTEELAGKGCGISTNAIDWLNQL